MKILYDHQIFSWQKYGGISRYFYELIQHLGQTQSVELDIALKYSNNEYLAEKDFYINKRDPRAILNKKNDMKYKLKRALIKDYTEKYNEKYAINYLQSRSFDIFHPTYYDPYFLEYIGNKPYVLTVYDMTHEIFPEYFGLSDQTSENKRIVLQHAKKIIAISENTKMDLMNFYGIDEDRIEVIYLGSSFDINKQNLDRTMGLPEKYILFVGNRKSYKNFYFFGLAIADILLNDELKLICAGGGEFSEEEKLFLKKLRIDQKVIYQNASNANLRMLYQYALAFVFPSLYEGFGIPVLEAFSCGCPVVLSNSSSLPEVAQDAAEYFDPKNISSIRTAIEKVIYSNEIRENLSNKGYQRLQHFSWSKMSRMTHEVYKSLLP